MNHSLNSAMNFIKENNDHFIEEFTEFLKIPSISSNSNHSNDMMRAAKFLVNILNECGIINTRILETQKYPVVFAEYRDAGKDKPTILMYGHYDVQPPDPLNQWTNDPFDPMIKDGFIYARGASDMKGQLMVILSAINAIQSTGSLPVNLKFMIEGEEEIGSPSIKTFLEENKELFKADFVLNLDAGMIAKDKPTIVYGLRGLAYFELHIYGPEHDLHSGLFGGIIYNPIQALTELIAGMKNSEGQILLPGFYDDVIPINEDERDALSKLNQGSEYFINQTGVRALWGEKGFEPVELIGARPTLDINGIVSGHVGEGPKTVIPSHAMAKLSMRLVPNQTPSKVFSQLTQYVEQNAPPQVKWEIKQLASDPACITDRNFYATKCLAKSLEEIWGVKPVYKREGGSIPIVAHMQEILGLESVLSGFGIPEDRIHSPNENMNLNIFFKGIETVINYLYKMAEEC